jgi:antitoxin MazE
MKTEIRKWGNSYAVRIPKPILEAACAKEGTEVELRVPRPGKVELSVVRRKRKLSDYLRKITPENLHGEIEWGGPVGREEW